MTGGSEDGDTGSINVTVRNSNCGNGGNIAVRAGLSQRHYMARSYRFKMNAAKC